jgi:hypothetical protein
VRHLKKPKTSRKKVTRAPVRAKPKRGARTARKTARKTAAAHASSPSRTVTYVWRRLHDGHIIAQASPVSGMGAWRVSAYRTTSEADDAEPYEPRAFSLLREAQHSADELVRQHFSHTCRTGVCGRWLRWPED